MKIFGWLSLGCVFLGFFGALFSLIPAHYRFHEPFYASPISLKSASIPIRNDSMGEGHFGASRSNNRVHQGIDIAAPLGESIYAAKSGRVSYAGPKGGYGQFVELKHPDGNVSRYAHMSQIHAQAGMWVARGTLLGLIGKTGNAKSRVIEPHLHFEIRDPKRALDPTVLIQTS